jgi:hypothetical protein
MNALKTLLAATVLAGFCTVCSAQQAPTNLNIEQFLGKNMPTVLKGLNIKDTTGLTSYAYAPQIEKATKFLALKTPSGDQLLFKDNYAKAVVYAQDKTKDKTNQIKAKLPGRK